MQELYTIQMDCIAQLVAEPVKAHHASGESFYDEISLVNKHRLRRSLNPSGATGKKTKQGRRSRERETNSETETRSNTHRHTHNQTWK